MSDNGSGTYSVNSTGQPVVGATLIDATVFNAFTADNATAMSNRIAKDGQTTVTADIPFNAKKITGLGAGTARTDAASLATIQDGTGVYVATVAGTADVITLTASPAIAAYVAGQTFRFIASGANTTNVTVAINGLAAKAITKNGSVALLANDLLSGSMVTITYDGTRFILGSIMVGNLTGGINASLTTVASAASPDIFALTVGNTIDYTGTATATGFAAAPQAGAQRTLVCAAASVFTAGANMLIDGLVSGQNFTAAAGDKLLVIAVTTTQFRLVPMLSSGIPANNGGFTTGDGKFTLKTAADVGWVMANDTSIGSATSGATGRANADTSALYTLIWDNMVDQYAPVATGRGGSAAADFSANKAMFLPKTLGRALAIGGTGTSSFSGVNADVDTATDGITVPTNNTKWITGMPVVFTLQSGTITGLTTATTYYIFRSSATLVKLCTTLANAQNGTVIDLTAKSTPVFTLVYSTAARILGEHSGEDAHAVSSTEQLAHTHTTNASPNFTAGSSPFQNGVEAGNPITSSSTGGNAAMNNLQSSSFWNAMIKL